MASGYNFNANPLNPTGFGATLTQNTQLNVSNSYVVRVQGVELVDFNSGNVIGVVSTEYEDLLNAFNETCDKVAEYKEMLIELGAIEKEYTQEELAELERQQDRLKIDNLTKAVSALIEQNERDRELIDNLTRGSAPVQQEQEFDLTSFVENHNAEKVEQTVSTIADEKAKSVRPRMKTVKEPVNRPRPQPPSTENKDVEEDSVNGE